MKQLLLNNDLVSGIKGLARFFPFAKKKREASTRRVVITGIGVVSPVGVGVNEFWENLLEGKTGLDRISLFDASTFPSQVAAEVKKFNPEKYLSRRQMKYFSRSTQFAVASAKMALEDSGIEYLDPYRSDVVIGSAVSSFNLVEEAVFRSPSSGRNYEKGLVDPHLMLKAFVSAPASAIALMVKTKGYVSTVSSACSSGINAVGIGAQRVMDGHADVVLAGGVDTPVTRFILAAYCSADFLTEQNDDPSSSLCPFDARRTRSALGEGSAVFLLEEREHAIARGARVYGEVISFVQETENINELFMLDRTGDNWSETIKHAVSCRDGISIDYINAHGPSDRHLDQAESSAIHKVFEEKARKIPVSSIKGAVGSGMASAGAFQIASAAMSLLTGDLPPIHNYRVPDPNCDLRFVKRKEHLKNINYVLVNGHALGGANAALVLGKFTV